jgi:hypothetical protein
MTEEFVQVMLIKRVIHRKNYKWFSNGIYNLNIIGIRSTNRKAGVFDDWICCIYKDENYNYRCRQWKATTDAGTFWLENPMNKKGTAMLVPNQYLNSWKIGLHKGKYEALVQHAPVSVYRDNNKDRIEDLDPKTIEAGLFGINIHRSNPVCESVINDKWSAGCQVFSNPSDFNEFMSLVTKSSLAFGKVFSYTLLESTDFDEVQN